MTTIEERHEISGTGTDRTLPCHADWLDLKKSTEIHIRGLKIQLAVAYATLKEASGMEKYTRPARREDEEIKETETETEHPDP